MDPLNPTTPLLAFSLFFRECEREERNIRVWSPPIGTSWTPPTSQSPTFRHMHSHTHDSPLFSRPPRDPSNIPLSHVRRRIIHAGINVSTRRSISTVRPSESQTIQRSCNLGSSCQPQIPRRGFLNMFFATTKTN